MIDEKKLIEKLEALKDKCWDRAKKENNINFARKQLDISQIIGIINNQSKIGEWIPCCERMPEEHDSIFARFKGTDRWNSSMFEKTSNTVNVTVESEKGERATMTAYTIDGKWKLDIFMKFNVIAWKPFPEPYQGNT